MIGGSYEVGQPVRARDVKIQEAKTRPPAYFTESSLVEAMVEVHKYVKDPATKKILKETQGIGTERTRGEIIKRLRDLGFLQIGSAMMASGLPAENRPSGKRLTSTERGRALIDALTNDLRDPGVTAKWEMALDMIAKGEASYELFIGKQHTFLRTVVDLVREGGEIKIPAGKK